MFHGRDDGGASTCRTGAQPENGSVSRSSPTNGSLVRSTPETRQDTHPVVFLLYRSNELLRTFLCHDFEQRLRQAGYVVRLQAFPTTASDAQIRGELRGPANWDFDKSGGVIVITDYTVREAWAKRFQERFPKLCARLHVVFGGSFDGTFADVYVNAVRRHFGLPPAPSERPPSGLNPRDTVEYYINFTQSYGEAVSQVLRVALEKAQENNRYPPKIFLVRHKLPQHAPFKNLYLFAQAMISKEEMGAFASQAADIKSPGHWLNSGHVPDDLLSAINKKFGGMIRQPIEYMKDWICQAGFDSQNIIVPEDYDQLIKLISDNQLSWVMTDRHVGDSTERFHAALRELGVSSSKHLHYSDALFRSSRSVVINGPLENFMTDLSSYGIFDIGFGVAERSALLDAFMRVLLPKLEDSRETLATRM